MADSIVEVNSSAVVRKQRRDVISAFTSKSLDKNPVAIYLARFATKEARRAQLCAMRTITKLIDPSNEDPHKIPWGEIRYPHVVALKTKLSEPKPDGLGLAPATVNRMLSALRGVAEEAMRLGLMKGDEFSLISKIRGVRGSREPAGRHLEADTDLTPIFEAVDTLDNMTCAIRDRAIFGALRVTGMRRQELVNISMTDVDWQTLKVRIVGKGNKERFVWFTNIANELRAWMKLRGREPGPVFCAVHKSGSVILRKMSPSSVAFILKRTADAAGIEQHLSPHDFRRTFVGDMLDAGQDVSVVQRLAGHASVTTTARYDRRPERVAEKAATVIKVPEKSRSKSQV